MTLYLNCFTHAGTHRRDSEPQALETKQLSTDIRQAPINGLGLAIIPSDLLAWSYLVRVEDDLELRSCSMHARKHLGDLGEVQRDDREHGERVLHPSGRGLARAQYDEDLLQQIAEVRIPIQEAPSMPQDAAAADRFWQPFLSHLP